jgi:hypothetical protein
MPTHTYELPVAKLLHYGGCKGFQTWPNYVQELGLTVDHIPALLQMLQDEELWTFFAEDYDLEDEYLAAGISSKNALWAPIHAWRSLGQLQAAEAVNPLAEVLQKYDYDWCWEEIPDVYGLIGAEAIDPLDELLSAKIHYNSKISLVSGVGKIVKTFPELRDRGVAVLTQQLSNYKNHHRSVNGSLIAELLDLNALESVPVMEEAYKAKKVDEMFVGSWARVQIDLGLKQEADFTAEELAIHYTPAQQQKLANIRAYVDRQQLKSSNSGLFTQGPGFEPAEFKNIASQVDHPKLSDKSGFGGGAKPSPKKGKKKK